MVQWSVWSADLTEALLKSYFANKACGAVVVVVSPHQRGVKMSVGVGIVEEPQLCRGWAIHNLFIAEQIFKNLFPK